MNSKEIEVKLKFKDKKKILSILSDQIRFQKKAEVYDKYYSQDSRSMSNVNELVRIRRVKNGSAKLTYKGKTKDKKNIWDRVELTTKIESPAVMEKILNKLGFKKISEYKSKREYWNYNNLKIIFIKFTAPAHLEFMELEGKSSPEIKRIISKINEYVEEVGEEIFKVFDQARKK